MSVKDGVPRRFPAITGGEHEDLFHRQIRASSVCRVLGLAWRQTSRLGDLARAGSIVGRQRWRAHRRDFVVLEAGGLALFALFAAGLLASRDWITANALWLSFAGLGVISLVSVVVGHPWTADYARAAYPDKAGTQQFRIINAAITGLWGVLFVARRLPLFGVPQLVSTAIVIAGALISIFGPRLAIRFVLKRVRAMQETFHWPAPSFRSEKVGIATSRSLARGSGDCRLPPCSPMRGSR